MATLPGLEPISGTSLIVYEPSIHLDLTKLSAKFHDNSSVRLLLPTSLPTQQDQRYQEGDRVLDQIEQQLHDFGLQRQETARHFNLIHGSYAGIGLLALLFLVYACHSETFIVASTCRTCCRRKKSPTSGEPDSATTRTILGKPETPASSQDVLTPPSNDNKETPGIRLFSRYTDVNTSDQHS